MGHGGKGKGGKGKSCGGKVAEREDEDTRRANFLQSCTVYDRSQMTHSVLGRDKRCPATQQMGVKEDEKGTFEESVIYFFRKKSAFVFG